MEQIYTHDKASAVNQAKTEGAVGLKYRDGSVLACDGNGVLRRQSAKNRHLPGKALRKIRKKLAQEQRLSKQLGE